MRSKRFAVFIAMALGAALGAACSDATSPDTTTQIPDSLVNADVAATAGDAIASTVENMVGNEASVGFDLSAGGILFDKQSPEDLTVQRSRVCYDANGAVQATCNGQTTDSIVFSLTINGTRTGSRVRNLDTSTYSVAVHRTQTLTVTGLLGTETQRTHNGNGSSNDTSSFTGPAGSRNLTEAATDSIVQIVFNLPRSTNPWPVSGSIIRNSSFTETLTRGDSTKTRSATRRVVVTFPADNQGNVALTVNGNACSLNLVTHKVTCS